MIPFRVQFRDGMPVSDQLSLAVRRAILSGELADGDSFPSVRTLAQDLKISPATIHKVVADLRDDGFLAVRPGIGMVVTVPPGSARDSRIALLQAATEALLREAAMLQAPLSEVMEAVKLTADKLKFPK
jgi:GntR family transcriptional regulator